MHVGNFVKNTFREHAVRANFAYTAENNIIPDEILVTF